MLDQVRHGGDVGRLQAVGRPDRQVQIVDGHLELTDLFFIHPCGGGGRFTGGRLTQLEVLHERVEVLAQDLCRFDQRHLRADRAVGPDFQRQLVEVGLLTDTGVFHLVTDTGHR